MKLHGNVYDLGNGFYKGTIYNLLPCDGSQLDGHYTLIFTKEADKVFVYKHGDYYNIISFVDVEFKGFLDLSDLDLNLLKKAIINTMQGKLPYSHPERKYVAQAIFDYDLNLFGIPVFWEKLNSLAA